RGGRSVSPPGNRPRLARFLPPRQTNRPHRPHPAPEMAGTGMVSAEWCRVAVDVLPMAVTVDGASMSASVESKAVPMETWMGTALYAVILWLIMKAVCGSVLTFLAEHGLTRANYRGEVVPTGAGLLLWLALL